MSETEGFEPDPSAELNLTPTSQTATPAGDWFAARDRERTHSPDCWQWHPSCAYSAGRREGLRSFAAELDEKARTYEKHPQVTDRMGRYAKGTLEAAAELAHRRAEGHHAVSGDAGTGNARADDGRGPENRPEGRDGCGADLCLPDFAGGSIVLRCDIPPAEHPGLNHHDPAYGAWWQPCDLPDHGHRES